MSNERSNLLFTVITAVTIGVSALYLGIQIQRNTDAIKANTVNDIKRTFAEHYAHVVESPDLSDVLLRSARDPASVSTDEKLRFIGALLWIFRAYENAYYAYVDGELDERSWYMFNRQIINLTKLPGVKYFWEERGDWYGPDFQEYIEEEIIPAPGSESYRLPED